MENDVRFHERVWKVMSRMARARGHTWGCLEIGSGSTYELLEKGGADPLLSDYPTVCEIDAATRLFYKGRHPGIGWGITAPALEQDEDSIQWLFHRTTTGKASYQVAEDPCGILLKWAIWRPHNVKVLEAAVQVAVVDEDGQYLDPRDWDTCVQPHVRINNLSYPSIWIAPDEGLGYGERIVWFERHAREFELLGSELIEHACHEVRDWFIKSMDFEGKVPFWCTPEGHDWEYRYADPESGRAAGIRWPKDWWKEHVTDEKLWLLNEIDKLNREIELYQARLDELQ